MALLFVILHSPPPCAYPCCGVRWSCFTLYTVWIHCTLYTQCFFLPQSHYRYTVPSTLFLFRDTYLFSLCDPPPHSLLWKKRKSDPSEKKEVFRFIILDFETLSMGRKKSGRGGRMKKRGTHTYILYLIQRQWIVYSSALAHICRAQHWWWWLWWCRNSSSGSSSSSK